MGDEARGRSMKGETSVCLRYSLRLNQYWRAPCSAVLCHIMQCCTLCSVHALSYDLSVLVVSPEPYVRNAEWQC